MSEFGTDELFLHGRVQVSTALGALAYTGANPEAQQQLQTFLEVHDQMSDGHNQNDLSIYLQGETAEREKADIVSSLETLCLDPATEEVQRLTAGALYTILR